MALETLKCCKVGWQLSVGSSLWPILFPLHVVIWSIVDKTKQIIAALMFFQSSFLNCWYGSKEQTLCIQWSNPSVKSQKVNCCCVFLYSGSVHGSSSCAVLSFCFSFGPTSGWWLKMISTSSTGESVISLCGCLWPRMEFQMRLWTAGCWPYSSRGVTWYYQTA